VLLPEHPQTENIWEQLPSFSMIYAVLQALEGQYEESGYYHIKKPVVRDLHSNYTQQLIFLGMKMSNLTSTSGNSHLALAVFRCFSCPRAS
jgi:hypothetical protein